MLLVFVRCAIVVGFAFILSRIERSMPRNKVCRFAFLYVLCVPVIFVISYVDCWIGGYHKITWTWAFIIGLLPAAYAFLPPQPNNPKKP